MLCGATPRRLVTSASGGVHDGRANGSQRRLLPVMELRLSAVRRSDLRSLPAAALAWSRPEVVSLCANALVIAVAVWLLREPLDARAYHQIAVTLALAALYSHSPHAEAKVAALAHIKTLLVQFAEIEQELHCRARELRNALALEYNQLQLEVDESKGWWYRWTTQLRAERIVPDTSALEGLARGSGSLLGDLLGGRLAPYLITTRGFGPVIFVLVPKDAQAASQLFATDELTVFGVFCFGRLLTRFHAAAMLVQLFPHTLESERVQRMRDDADRLKERIRLKELELHSELQTRYGLKLVAA